MILEEEVKFEPQPGFQTEFLSSMADIVIGGGAAGAGKTYAELLEPLNHEDVPNFNAVFFRKTLVQVTNPGGLWDESSNIYPHFSAESNKQRLSWTFPSGAVVKFSHLENEKNIYDHQGAQYCLIIFDELTHFTRKMFFYLLSRNRSVCGVKPYVRATCNPDPESFVADMIEWWIDQDERLPNGEPNPRYGYPISERAGVVRFFIVDKEAFVWGDTKQEVIDKCPHIFEAMDPSIDKEELVKSFTFIPGTIYGNKELMKKNPAYLANLMAQDEDEKARLMEGNWKIKIDPLCLFNGMSVEGMFSNLYPSNTNQRYISCDAARLGEDLCTVFVWYGWKVVHLEVLTTSLPQEVVDTIEKLRERFQIVKGKVIIDQDGVGGGVVKLGHYQGFSGGDVPLEDPSIRKKENYKNLKTQCYYRFAERVNNDEVALPLSNENVVVDGGHGVKIKLKGKVRDVRDLIKSDLRAIKMKDRDSDGKLQINPKEEQKQILGRSPDFGDGLMMRVWFEFKSGELRKATGSGGSLLDRL